MNFSADFLRKYGVKQFQPRNATANCEFKLLIPYLIVLQLFAIWIILIFVTYMDPKSSIVSTI